MLQGFCYYSLPHWSGRGPTGDIDMVLAILREDGSVEHEEGEALSEALRVLGNNLDRYTEQEDASDDSLETRDASPQRAHMRQRAHTDAGGSLEGSST